MADPAHIIILRFSAMGDVALLAPVLKSATSQNKTVRFTLITKPKFAPLFSSLSNVEVFPADVDSEFSGITGLWRLAKIIRSMNPSTLIDVHDHLRTKIIRLFLSISGMRLIVFDKGRKEKNNFIKAITKENIQPLLHTCERYRLAFLQAGLIVSTAAEPPFSHKGIVVSLPDFLESARGKRLIGIAPFAAHFTKIWPLEKFKQVIQDLSDEKEIVFLLFGGGESEIEKLDAIEHEQKNCINLAGRLSLPEEISLMGQLDLMVCVDSSNMHLASLTGTPVLSVWGGTHTGTGFGPFPNPGNRIIEIPAEELSCRPCSVYGLSACPRKDHACMQQIMPSTVTKAIKEMLAV